jgi:hypothetical protein
VTRREALSWTWPLLFGIWLGWLVDPLGLGDELWGLYDSAFPVVTAKATTQRFPDGRFAVLMSGVKHRPCELEAVFAYDRLDTPRPIRTRLHAQRLDGAINSSHPVGAFRAGVPWIITPPPTGALEIWIKHRCGERSVLTKAEVAGG